MILGHCCSAPLSGPSFVVFNDAIMASTDDYLIKSDSGEWCSLIT